LSAAAARRILIVEDEMMIAMMIADMLAELGHQVAGVAHRLESALELAQADTFDMAILDINLRGEQSFPVAKLLTERGVPFLFATGYGTDGLEDPFRDVLTLRKPFAMGQLSAAVDKVAQAGVSPAA
jgi:DNA-binding response OmpR family regulator